MQAQQMENQQMMMDAKSDSDMGMQQMKDKGAMSKEIAKIRGDLTGKNMDNRTKRYVSRQKPKPENKSKPKNK